MNFKKCAFLLAFLFLTSIGFSQNVKKPDSNSKPLSAGKIINGKKEGKWDYYYRNNNKHSSDNYKKEGVWKLYNKFEDFSLGTFKNGKRTN